LLGHLNDFASHLVLTRLLCWLYMCSLAQAGFIAYQLRSTTINKAVITLMPCLVYLPSNTIFFKWCGFDQAHLLDSTHTSSLLIFYTDIKKAPPGGAFF